MLLWVMYGDRGRVGGGEKVGDICGGLKSCIPGRLEGGGIWGGVKSCIGREGAGERTCHAHILTPTDT